MNKQLFVMATGSKINGKHPKKNVYVHEGWYKNGTWILCERSGKLLVIFGAYDGYGLKAGMVCELADRAKGMVTIVDILDDPKKLPQTSIPLYCFK